MGEGVLWNSGRVDDLGTEGHRFNFPPHVVVYLRIQQPLTAPRVLKQLPAAPPERISRMRSNAEHKFHHHMETCIDDIT